MYLSTPPHLRECRLHQRRAKLAPWPKSKLTYSAALEHAFLGAGPCSHSRRSSWCGHVRWLAVCCCCCCCCCCRRGNADAAARGATILRESSKNLKEHSRLNFYPIIDRLWAHRGGCWQGEEKRQYNEYFIFHSVYYMDVFWGSGAAVCLGVFAAWSPRSTEKCGGRSVRGVLVLVSCTLAAAC